MNIFLLNNNFHYSYLVKHFPENILNESYFIVIPHKINKDIFINKKVLILENPVHTIRDLFKIKKIKSELHKIKHHFGNDFKKYTLYVLSEQDYLNVAVINLFKSKNSNIILLEDGTFTPVFLTINKNFFKFKYIYFYIHYYIFFTFVKVRLGINELKLNFIYNMPAMRMTDEIYSYIYISSKYNPNREIITKKIKPILIKKMSPLENIEFTSGIAVFANSPHYLDIGNQYFDILEKSFNYIIDTYKIKEVFFCFHPRETKDSIDRIKVTLSNKDYIKYVDGISTYECVKDTLPEYLFSFMSTTIIELSHFCKENIFLIQKFPEIMFPEVSKKMIQYINTIEI